MKIIVLASFVFLVLIMLGVTSGLKCYRCFNCPPHPEGGYLLRDALECPGPDALCSISEEGPGNLTGQGRRSCTNDTSYEPGKCYTTNTPPVDAWWSVGHDRIDYFKNDTNRTFTTCYCNNTDGCNGSNPLVMTSALWSWLPLTFLLSYITL